MMGGDRGYALVVVATAIAVATTGVLAFAPLTTTVTPVASEEAGVEASRPSPERVERQSLAEAQGWGEVARIAVPFVAVTATPLLAPSGRRARILRTVSTALLFLGAAAAFASFGIFVLPSAVLMLGAAVLSNRWQSETSGA